MKSNLSHIEKQQHILNKYKHNGIICYLNKRSVSKTKKEKPGFFLMREGIITVKKDISYHENYVIKHQLWCM